MLCLPILKMLPFIKKFPYCYALCWPQYSHWTYYASRTCFLPLFLYKFPRLCPNFKPKEKKNLHCIYAKQYLSAKLPADFIWKGPCPRYSKWDWVHTAQYVHTIRYTPTRMFKCRHREKFFPEIHFHSCKREQCCLPSENRSKPPLVILGIRKPSYLHWNR